MMTDNHRLTPLQQYVHDIVAEICDVKRGNTDPCMAHIKEIRNSINVEVMEALRELCRKGILSYHIDINKNLMFSTTEK